MAKWKWFGWRGWCCIWGYILWFMWRDWVKPLKTKARLPVSRRRIEMDTSVFVIKSALWQRFSVICVGVVPLFWRKSLSVRWRSRTTKEDELNWPPQFRYRLRLYSWDVTALNWRWETKITQCFTPQSDSIPMYPQNSGLVRAVSLSVEEDVCVLAHFKQCFVSISRQ
jgi:hypothetical protein